MKRAAFCSLLKTSLAALFLASLPGCTSESAPVTPGAGSQTATGQAASEKTPSPSEAPLETAGSPQAPRLPQETRDGSPLIIPDLPADAPEVWRKAWLTSYEQAKQQAAAENKDILMNFTGSDWCGWCITLADEAFSKPAFNEEALKHFVLLELDYPKGKELPVTLQAQNDSLQARYQIEGFPTILLTDSSGRPYARTGYQPGGARGYLAHLKELREVRAQRDAALAAASGLQGVEKAKQIDKALKVLAPDVLFPEYQPEVDQIIALDPDNAAGLKKDYQTQSEGYQLRGKLREIQNLLGAPGSTDHILASLKELEKEFPAPEHRSIFIQYRMTALQIDGRWAEMLRQTETLLKEKDLSVEQRTVSVIARVIALVESDRVKEAVALLDAELPALDVKSEEGRRTAIRFHEIKARLFARMTPAGNVRSAIDEALKLATPEEQEQLNELADQLLMN